MAETVTQLITNTADKSVLLTPELTEAIPNIPMAWARTDSAYMLYSASTQLKRMEQSQFTTRSQYGQTLHGSLLTPLAAGANEALVVFAPFSHSAPHSSAEIMARYVSRDPSVRKSQAKPNTWNQITKSVTTADLLAHLGRPMPVLTLFAPVPMGDRAGISDGNFEDVAGNAVRDALRYAHRNTDVRIGNDTTLHFSGASLGASHAVGAALKRVKEDGTIGSVTLQEPVLGPRTVLDLFKRFTVSGLTGEASTTPFVGRKLGEVMLRQEIDHQGSEVIGMNGRMLQGAARLPYMRGLTQPYQFAHHINTLADNTTAQVSVATADHSALSSLVREEASLLTENVAQMRLTPEAGARLGHIADEFVTLSALVVALNVIRAETPVAKTK